MTYQQRRTGPKTTVVYNRPSIMAHRPPVRPVLNPTRIVRGRGLGALGQNVITGNPTVDTFIEGVAASPWLYIGGGLLLYYAITGSFGKPKRRRKGSGVSLLTVATLAAGAGALGYLAGGGSLSNL
jgi:hypothetical protein